MSRKTIEVADLLERVNTALTNDSFNDTAKSGMRSIIESVLHETGNYKGFSYTGGWQGVEHNNVVYAVHPRIAQEYSLYQEQRKKQGGLR